MKRPQRFLIRMIAFVVACIGVFYMLFGPLQSAFMANVPLNSLIVGVLVLGIVYNFRQVLALYGEVDWIDGFRHDRLGRDQTPPRLLISMATMLGESSLTLRLSAISMRSVLDGIATRLDESRDISRYTIGLLVFLGLLGTFWGLLDTVSSIRGVIDSLSISGNDDIASAFISLKQGLERPLGGMGTAFSSSLLGLAGSLILGFLDLQASQAQNRFFNDLEEWLSSVTRLSSGGISTESDQSVPAYVQALLEQTADSLENLQRTLTKGEESRIAVNSNLQQMSEQMGTLTDHMRTEQAIMRSMAESQVNLNEALRKMSENANALTQGGTSGFENDATRSHIRNMDMQMGRLVDELANGRNEILTQVRSEIKLLARTIAALVEDSKT